jgi:deoxyribodipyrimidine photo-lyase
MAQCHWLLPAHWMYAHLWDGDLASNCLSWQWVVGTNSKKKYFANQANVNKYFETDQKGTFLDVPYDQFEKLPIPSVLSQSSSFSVPDLPSTDVPRLQKEKSTLVYTYYNLDSNWHKGDDVQRVLLLEPSVFAVHGVAPKSLQFAIELAQTNIPGIQVFVGEFSELVKQVDPATLHYKEHPLNTHYQGIKESRQWMTSVTGAYPSFFAFWKKTVKELRW